MTKDSLQAVAPDGQHDLSDRSATLAILNGRIWTGVNGAHDAEAIAISGSRVVAIGTTKQIQAGLTRDTRTIDAEGRRIIPGITDSHTHFLRAGLQMARLELSRVRSREEFVTAVADAAAGLGTGQWLLGGRYATEHWTTPAKPTKDWIDSVTSGHPVYLTRADLHQALVNSAALALAGITRTDPADPPGGEIERDPTTGEPTGILKDSAMELVEARIPAPDEATRLAAMERAAEAANRWGITSVHDMSMPDEADAYAAFCRRDRATIRMHVYMTAMDFPSMWPVMCRFDASDPMFRVVGFKAFVDGSLGSRTAYMSEPYADATDETRHPKGLRAKWAADWEAFETNVRWAHQQGAQLAIHAIGDQAVHDLLDLYGTLPTVGARRHRIEHAQHVLPQDLGRFSEHGIIASMQPLHKADDGPWAMIALGADRFELMYPWGSLLETGARVCFGSDVPVASNNPFAAIAIAVTGRLPSGETCVAAQNIGVHQALRCYTSEPPMAVFRENELGTLEPGKLADLAILDQDILESPEETWAETTAYRTIVGGQVVWPRES